MDHDFEDIPLIYVCRDIPGEHVGGPECFCSPTVHTADETTEEIVEASAAASRRQ